MHIKNNPEKLPTTKVLEHIPSRFSMSAVLSFKDIRNMHGVNIGQGCMKKFFVNF